MSLSHLHKKQLEEFDENLELLKKEAGEIPENTCPDIDKCLKEIEGLEKEISYLDKNSNRYDTAEEMAKDLPSVGWLDTPSKLEELRRDNEQLRNLGKFWYEEYKNSKPNLTLSTLSTLQAVWQMLEEEIKLYKYPDGADYVGVSALRDFQKKIEEEIIKIKENV